MTKTFLMAAAIALGTMGLHAQKQELTLLKGHVTNQGGIPIAGAKVTAYYILDDEPFATTTTDSDGFYDISFETEYDISAYEGYYVSVKVSADGCATYTREIDPLTPLFLSGKGKQDFMLYDAVTLKAGVESPLVLPIAPDPEAGSYYELSRLEHKGMDASQHSLLSLLVFTRTLEPKANTPYLFVPNSDYTISFKGLDLSGTPETTSLGDSVFFTGGFASKDMELPMNHSIFLLGNSTCCHQPNNDERAYRTGPCHGFIIFKNGYKIINGLSIVLEENDNPKNTKCATPTIAYDKGRLVFVCDTSGAECVYEIKCTDTGSGHGSEVSLNQTCEIHVHATLNGYQDSDEAVATIGWRNGQPVMEGFSSVTMEAPTDLPPLGEANADVNGDGKVDVADIATIISVMAAQPSE